jgi:hypothetical protein
MKSEFDYICRNQDCEHEFELQIEYSPIIPAQTYGPPENCYPEEGGDFDILSPDACPKCGTAIDSEKAAEDFFEKLADARYDDDRDWESD